MDADAHAWAAFASASSDDAFCAAWLTLQCSLITGVQAGLLLLHDEASQTYVPAAVWPDPRRDLSYLTEAAERSLSQRRGAVLGLDASERERLAPDSVHVAYPIETDASIRGTVVLDLTARSEPQLQSVLRQLLWGAGWLEAMLRRRGVGREALLLERAATVIDLLQAAQQHHVLDHAALAIVNELATKVHADRVSLGMERDGKLKLRAISRTALFDSKSQLVESIANAMEEVIDQESGVSVPPVPAARGRVNVAVRDLAARAGDKAVLGIPLTSGGEPVGALVLERSDGPVFDADTVLLCEMLGELLGPALDRMLHEERWFGGRLVDKLAQWRDDLLGPRRPALKLSAALVVLAALFLTFADGEFRVSAKTVVEGAVQRAVVAPFEGYLAEALVRAGETVTARQLLARLDDRDLRLERVRWSSEREQAERKYREALAKRDRAASRILAAQLSQAEAQLALIDEKLARTRLLAPFDGIVVSGDLSQFLGAPLEQGKVLFELAPLDAYRVILKVDERDIGYVTAAQPGELALTGLGGRTYPFTVKTITSVSTPQDGRNFFRVEAALEQAPPTLRPGMEGIGKIAAGERRLVWIWTRNFVDWARISFWAWLP
ncbi:MAG: hypothetical protein A3H35_11385 [Betaproteobacteria bacterium RIFCSPLOWO2_02_FULL_62_17]|nr:MAG: hypothetical protein A3H35_11385 [Betaproteobacteria bacterium RIFCSPLOWO2_02_FULL_62_17]